MALGVSRGGQKEVSDLELLASESTLCWTGFVEGLISRGLRRPRLVIIDGNKRLRAAVEQIWSGVPVQRCTVHKLRNLERYVPRHAVEEMRSDYHRIIRADSLDEARKAYREFISTEPPGWSVGSVGQSNVPSAHRPSRHGRTNHRHLNL